MRLGIAVLLCWLGCAVLSCAGPACDDEIPEYRLKSAFLYNFARFTDWPAEVGATLNLCIIAPDPFGTEIDALQGKLVGERSIAVLRRARDESLRDCQIVFIGPGAFHGLGHVLDTLRGRAVLTVADTPGATHQGVALNLTVTQDRISFEANQLAARSAGLDLSSQLLRLASDVIR